MVRLRTLTPSIEVRILAGHPSYSFYINRLARSDREPSCCAPFLWYFSVFRGFPFTPGHSVQHSCSMKWPPWRETTFEEAWDEHARPWTQVRRLSDHQLIERLATDRLDPTYKLALEAEQRRRESWRAPAGKAVRISIVALLVSIAALAKSFIE
jgi:hypothetical protein